MPSTIDLAAIQNQTFTTTLDNNRYVMKIYQAANIMCCDITCNEVVLVSGGRMMPGEFLIPFFCYSGINGNFLILTQNDDLVDYTQFGITQIFIYQSVEEIAADVGGTVP